MILSHERLGQRLYMHATFSMDARCRIGIGAFKDTCFTKLCALAEQKLKVTQVDREKTMLHLLLEPIVADDGTML